MAAPFGGHPTLGIYADWALKQGCTVKYGTTMAPSGRAVSILKITAPSGKRVVATGTLQDEHLAPTTIARFDRRLGLKSPFFSLPDNFDDV